MKFCCCKLKLNWIVRTEYVRIQRVECSGRMKYSFRANEFRFKNVLKFSLVKFWIMLFTFQFFFNLITHASHFKFKYKPIWPHTGLKVSMPSCQAICGHAEVHLCAFMDFTETIRLFLFTWLFPATDVLMMSASSQQLLKKTYSLFICEHLIFDFMINW